MKTLVALLLLPAAALAQPNGALFLHLRGGYHVLVDGTDTGATTDDVGGKVTPIAAGRHHIIVRSPEGREAQFDVTIAAGMTTDITLSPLGFRKPVPATDDPGALHVVCVPEDCTVMFRDKDKMANDDTLDAIPAGRYPLAATHGASTLRADVDIPAATVVTLEANFNTRTTRIVETKHRVRKLVVAEQNDALAYLNVPGYWKSAIRSALPAGVTVYQAMEVGGYGVRTTLRVPSDDVGWALIEAFERSTQFSRITIPAAPRREGSAIVVDFTFYFPPNH
ncbi:MAG TPA: hypothetical protein VJ853_01640 [Thermoanaerobaculia bacterium]|nr:hypothetical protein [Thermoanaerobaculia bacterium]